MTIFIGVLQELVRKKIINAFVEFFLSGGRPFQVQLNVVASSFRIYYSEPESNKIRFLQKVYSLVSVK